jgi:hypothetical protein
MIETTTKRARNGFRTFMQNRESGEIDDLLIAFDEQT